MASYLTEAFGRFVWQVVQLFGIPFALAFALVANVILLVGVALVSKMVRR